MTSQILSPFDIMCHLVAFPTVSKDSNLPLIDWVETYLKSHHITPHRCYNGEKDKAALFAHVGPETAGGVVLSGHSDVVPVAGHKLPIISVVRILHLKRNLKLEQQFRIIYFITP